MKENVVRTKLFRETPNAHHCLVVVRSRDEKVLRIGQFDIVDGNLHLYDAKDEETRSRRIRVSLVDCLYSFLRVLCDS